MHKKRARIFATKTSMLCARAFVPYSCRSGAFSMSNKLFSRKIDAARARARGYFIYSLYNVSSRICSKLLITAIVLSVGKFFYLSHQSWSSWNREKNAIINATVIKLAESPIKHTLRVDEIYVKCIFYVKCSITFDNQESTHRATTSKQRARNVSLSSTDQQPTQLIKPNTKIITSL